MQARSSFSLLIFFLLLLTIISSIEGQSCKPSGKLKGKKRLQSNATRRANPSAVKKAVLTLNSFEKNGDGGGPSKCDNKFHSDDTPVVALSTGWFNKQQRCLKNITIYGNGWSVKAMVVDECDSTMGCDADHDYQPPCDNNIVDAAEAVWKALGVPKHDQGELGIYWSDP
ncbi:unnamed protein product [Ilex paraguariensis]|uniref:Ripening-related protein 1 n=1 Tax=Ilex paraguariensis TaxID=185542 RepID=A0ABC8RPT2_9AQUA